MFSCITYALGSVMARWDILKTERGIGILARLNSNHETRLRAQDRQPASIAKEHVEEIKREEGTRCSYNSELELLKSYAHDLGIVLYSTLPSHLALKVNS
jgi:hypothetical protein